MGTLAAFILTTLDGYVEGPDREFDFWQGLDADFTEFSVRQLDAADALLFGRVTYEGMAAYWQSQAARDEAPDVQARMQRMPKLVASTTLGHAAWSGTRVVRSADEVAAAAHDAAGETLVLGSATLTGDLVRRQLLDELRLLVNPVAIGTGRPLLPGAPLRATFTLLDTRVVGSGNVLLTYRPR